MLQGGMPLYGKVLAVALVLVVELVAEEKVQLYCSDQSHPCLDDGV